VVVHPWLATGRNTNLSAGRRSHRSPAHHRGDSHEYEHARLGRRVDFAVRSGGVVLHTTSRS
jgi:hypothetical protein